MFEALLPSASSLIATLAGFGTLGAIGLLVVSRLLPAPLSTLAFVASLVVGAPALFAWGSSTWALVRALPGTWATVAPIDSADSATALLTEVVLPVVAIVIVPAAGVLIAVSLARAQITAAVVTGAIGVAAWALGWDGIHTAFS